MTGQSSSGGNAHSVETRAFLSGCHCRSLVCEMEPLPRQSVYCCRNPQYRVMILAQADANPWQAALDYAMIYFLAVWKAAVLG